MARSDETKPPVAAASAPVKGPEKAAAAPGIDPPVQRPAPDIPRRGDHAHRRRGTRCLIHAPNESVDPAEIEHMALAEALFLANYPT